MITLKVNRFEEFSTFLSCNKRRKKTQNLDMEQRTVRCKYCKSNKRIEDLKETMMVSMTLLVHGNEEISLTATKEVTEAVFDIKTDQDQLLGLNRMCIVYNIILI